MFVKSELRDITGREEEDGDGTETPPLGKTAPVVIIEVAVVRTWGDVTEAEYDPP